MRRGGLVKASAWIYGPRCDCTVNIVWWWRVCTVKTFIQHFAGSWGFEHQMQKGETPERLKCFKVQDVYGELRAKVSLWSNDAGKQFNVKILICSTVSSDSVQVNERQISTEWFNLQKNNLSELVQMGMNWKSWHLDFKAAVCNCVVVCLTPPSPQPLPPSSSSWSDRSSRWRHRDMFLHRELHGFIPIRIEGEFPQIPYKWK